MSADHVRRATVCYLLDAIKRQIRHGCHPRQACERCNAQPALVGHGTICAPCLTRELGELIPVSVAEAYTASLFAALKARADVDTALDALERSS